MRNQHTITHRADVVVSGFLVQVFGTEDDILAFAQDVTPQEIVQFKSPPTLTVEVIREQGGRWKVWVRDMPDAMTIVAKAKSMGIRLSTRPIPSPTDRATIVSLSRAFDD